MTASPSIPAAIARIAPDGRLTARQRRHFLLERLVDRPRLAGTGSTPESLRRRTAMHAWPDLRRSLEGIPWALVGGVATRAYMPERMTKDMDVLVRAADGPAAVERLAAAGYERIADLAIPGVTLKSPDGVEVDVLFGDQAWIDEALAQPSLDAAGFPVIDLPYLVLMKLQSARAQDWADVSRMLGQADDARIDAVRRVVGQFSPEDAEDLEALVFLGRAEMEELAGEG